MCSATSEGQRRGAEVWNGGKEHNIPWRIKFLSCCIVDILTDDVTLVLGFCRLQEIGSVQIGVPSTNIQTCADTHQHTLSLCFSRSLSLSRPISHARAHTHTHTYTHYMQHALSPALGMEGQKIVLTVQVWILGQLQSRVAKQDR